MNDAERRTLARMLMEDPDRDHAADVGVELDLMSEVEYITSGTATHVAEREQQHPSNLLAQTMQVPRDARHTTGPDMAAFHAVFDDLDQD